MSTISRSPPGTTQHEILAAVLKAGGNSEKEGHRSARHRAWRWRTRPGNAASCKWRCVVAILVGCAGSPHMFAQDLSFSGDHQTFRINPQAHRAVRKMTLNAVAICVQKLIRQVGDTRCYARQSIECGLLMASELLCSAAPTSANSFGLMLRAGYLPHNATTLACVQQSVQGREDRGSRHGLPQSMAGILHFSRPAPSPPAGDLQGTAGLKYNSGSPCEKAACLTCASFHDQSDRLARSSILSLKNPAPRMHQRTRNHAN